MQNLRFPWPLGPKPSFRSVDQRCSFPYFVVCRFYYRRLLYPCCSLLLCYCLLLFNKHRATHATRLLHLLQPHPRSPKNYCTVIQDYMVQHMFLYRAHAIRFCVIHYDSSRATTIKSTFCFHFQQTLPAKANLPPADKTAQSSPAAASLIRDDLNFKARAKAPHPLNKFSGGGAGGVFARGTYVSRDDATWRRTAAAPCMNF